LKAFAAGTPAKALYFLVASTLQLSKLKKEIIR
jgi:hypothetical protein